jgi:hypothetical protein
MEKVEEEGRARKKDRLKGGNSHAPTVQFVTMDEALARAETHSITVAEMLASPSSLDHRIGPEHSS